MKILVIDDDPAMTELLKIILEPTEANVITTNSGAVGLQKFKEINPDFVLLDLIMPGMDGWQVCQEIRSISRVPIMIISVLDNPGLVARALDMGADDFLVKPIKSAVLIAHINNLSRRSPEINPQTTPLKRDSAVYYKN
jgi:Response regulators consisting of a CheY-like receiver domain and a winged-helix DNA-binding domain